MNKIQKNVCKLQTIKIYDPSLFNKQSGVVTYNEWMNEWINGEWNVVNM